jgi:hypothetical protein
VDQEIIDSWVGLSKEWAKTFLKDLEGREPEEML